MKSARFTAISAALLLASVSAPALAANNALVIGSYGTDGLTDRLQVAGYDVTTANDLNAITDLSTFTQVWDLRYSTALSTSESTMMMDYLGNGGGLFLIGEDPYYNTRNDSIVSFINGAGGGGLTYSGNATQTIYVTDTFNGDGTVVSSTSEGIPVVVAATFGNAGNGTYFLTTQPNGGGEGVGVAFGKGSLANALDGRIVSYLDVDTFPLYSLQQYTALRNLTDRMISFVAGGFQVDPSLPPVNGGPTVIDGSQPSFDLTSPAASGQTVTFDGGTLAMTDGAAGTTLAADVVLNDGGGFIDTLGADTSITGNISGTGGLNANGGGILLLSGTNTHTGGVMVMGGTKLAITTAAALGTGGVVLNFGTLHAIDNMRIDNNVMLMGSNNGFDVRTSNVEIAGVIEGNGGFIKGGAGTLVLSGANTYLGNTVIADGRIVGNTGSIKGNVVNLATLEFNQALNGVFSGNISGTGTLVKSGGSALILTGENTYTGGTLIAGGTLVGSTKSLTGNIVNNSVLQFDQSDDGTFAGDISGNGLLVKNGDGTLTLTGNNSYTNGTVINGGTLAASTQSLGGDVANFATLQFNQATDGTFTGEISGTGMLVKTGAGTLTLTGGNSYQGGTKIVEGTLAGDTNSLSRDIVNDATLQFDQTSDGTFAGVVSGTGMLVKTGSGALTLTGANSYTGGTTISEGTLVGNTASLSGNVVNNATLQLDQATDGNFAGNVSGTGALVKTGNGTLTLTGANSYTGGTTIAGGMLVANAGSLSGTIANDATLQFDQATNGTFAGDVSGTGGMVKTGAGKLELTGTGSYTGPTLVQAGALAVNGTLASTVDVQADARLMGRGTIGGLIVRTEATLAPGNSIDTLHVATTALFEADSIYEVEVNAAGDADRLIADGAVTIEGGQVAVLAENGDYAPLSTYTIITGASVNGTFEGVTSNLAFLSPSLSYTGTDVTLQLLRNDLAFSAAAATANQRGTALAIDTAFAADTPLYDALVGESAAGARAAFDSLSGEVHTAAIRSVMEDSERFRRSILGRFSADDAAAGGVWVQGAVARDEVRTDFNAAKFDRSTTSLFGGVEFGAGPAKFGIAGGYTDGDAKVAGRASTAAVQGTQVGAYAGTDAGPLALTLGATYGGFDVDTTRDIGVGAIDQTARASYSMETFEAFGEAGVRLQDGRNLFVPFVGLNKLWIDRDGVTETGASLGVRAASQDDSWLWSTVGAKAFVPLGASDSVALNLAARWQHALDGRAVDTDLALLAGGPAFTVAGAPLAKDTGMVDVGLSWRMAKGLTFGLEYNGAASNAHESHTGKATLAFRF
ncbi:conserved hypothetical protein [Altererythrobacter sp. B11]|uniref:autotransporter-associated beta strand repeat-containing protein n=1 Tax=Altererythrobacter sp. B11 TaxID=2060312 RepID=UPI000DC729D6|nr:autotransporter-associated beta strand repeat-containing protein [Altererythrobacter sp. B11]BBC73767.1 conserved hypothetical protein [Altererythrobacter sp. B11]